VLCRGADVGPISRGISAGPLDPVWTVNVSKGNTVALDNGALKISALANTYAHIQRPLGVDLVRVAGTLKSGGWPDVDQCDSPLLGPRQLVQRSAL